jgi:hypothetical protein
MLEWQLSSVLSWHHFKLFKRFKNTRLNSIEKDRFNARLKCSWTRTQQAILSRVHFRYYIHFVLFYYGASTRFGVMTSTFPAFGDNWVYTRWRCEPHAQPQPWGLRYLSSSGTLHKTLPAWEAAAGNFTELRLIFGGPQYGTSCMTPFWGLEYKGVSYILRETRAPILYTTLTFSSLNKPQATVF